MGGVCALDLASVTGVAIGEPGNVPTFQHHKFSREGEAGSMDGIAEASGRALVWWIEFLKVHAPEHVVIEAPIPERALGEHTNAWSTARKFQLLGVFASVCKAKSVPLRFANIQKVRKLFIGHGNLPGDKAKKEVMRFCKAAGWNPETYDEADAGAVWHFECHRLAPQKVQIINPLFLGIQPVQVPIRHRKAADVRVAPKRFVEQP